MELDLVVIFTFVELVIVVFVVHAAAFNSHLFNAQIFSVLICSQIEFL